MKNARFAALALAACLVAAFVVPGVASAKKAGPVVIGTDADNDWGGGAENALAGDALGQELVEASIDMLDAKTVNFIIKVKSLPPSGGTPELSRYTWDFLVNGDAFQLDGKFTNYSRGACDPTSGQCPPPRDPGLYPFLLRGNCRLDATATNVTICDELAKMQGVFDAAAGTISIPVGLDVLKAKAGTKIMPGVNSTFGGMIVAIPSAFFSNASMPMDLLTGTVSYKIPKL